jgi:hypothetical protein
VTGPGGDEFGFSVSVSDTGQWAVAGARQAIANSQSGAGKVQTFESSNANPPAWIADTYLHTKAPAAGANLGYSVSVSSSGLNSDATIFAGHPFQDTASGGTMAGSVTAFEYSSGNGSWTVYQIFVANNESVGANFGWSVSVSGDKAIVGAPSHSAGEGRAFMLERLKPLPVCFINCWQPLGANLGLELPKIGDEFGTSVSLSGDVAVVGSPGTRFSTGSAHVFRNNGSTWEQTLTLLPSGDQVPFHQFGRSVAVSGEFVVAGKRRDEQNGDSSGAAYVYYVPEPDAGTGIAFGAVALLRIARRRGRH